jgi:hypothetical protein
MSPNKAHFLLWLTFRNIFEDLAKKVQLFVTFSYTKVVNRAY